MNMNDDNDRKQRLNKETNMYIYSHKYHQPDACGKITKDNNEWLLYNACKETDSIETIIQKINRGSKCVSLRKDVWFIKHLVLYPEASIPDSNHRAELQRTERNLEECKRIHTFKIKEQNKETVRLIIQNRNLTKELGKLLTKK